MIRTMNNIFALGSNPRGAFFVPKTPFKIVGSSVGSTAKFYTILDNYRRKQKTPEALILLGFIRTPLGTRTLDTLIKSQGVFVILRTFQRFLWVVRG